MTTTIINELPWVHLARSDIGIKEIVGIKHNPLVLAMWKLIRRSGIKNDETPWCAAAVGSWFERVGIASSRYESADSYLNWGVECGLVYGAVIVMTRLGGNHVGILVGMDEAGNFLVLGGNQSNEVNISNFKFGGITGRKILGCRLPDSRYLPGQALPIIKLAASLSSRES